MSRVFSFAVIAGMISLNAPALHAQVAAGTFRGRVLDRSGAVLPEATVTFTNVDTGFTRALTTNARGEFDAPIMPLGEYRISAGFSGFQTKVVRGITLQVDQVAVIEIVLDPGVVTESVEVTTAAPLLQAQDSSIGQVIENKRIVELPLNGRNPFALGLLAGGVVPFSGLATNLPFIAGGGRHSANDILLDGVDDNTRNFRGSSGRNGISYIPSVDAVQEFKVKTNNFAAEYGRSAGYTMNATIKSGTNEFHGALFEFLRNDRLDANNFVSNFAGRPKSKFRQNQYGSVLGGPVLLPRYNGRNRTFFFVNHQGTRVREAAGQSLSDVAPASYRSGDFSSSPRRLYDPATRRLASNGIVTAELFPNNLIPRSRMDPIALKIQDFIPAPNVGSAESTSRNFLATSPRGTNWDQGDVKIDHRINGANNLTVRLSLSQQYQPNQGAYIFSPTEQVLHTRNIALIDTHIFSPNIVNEFRFGFNRSNSSNIALLADEASAFAAQNGLQSGPILGFPDLTFNFTGDFGGQNQFSAFGAARSNLIFENNFQFADNVTIVHGNHTLKAGVDIRRLRFDRYRNFPMTGQYYFGAIFTANPSVTGQTGIPYAEFLLGTPSRITGQNQIDWARQRDLFAGWFLQDDWRITRRLTFNLGIRYDLYTQPVDARDRGGVFDPNLASPAGRFGVIRRPGQDGNSRAVVQGDHDNIAPRFGFAFQMTPKFVIRGGYGMFYSQREQNDEITVIGDTLLNQHVITSSVVNPDITITPPIRFNTPLTVESSIDPFFSRYTAQRPLASEAGSANAADIGNSRFPMLQQFNLSLQYEFVSGLLVEADYAGARGIRWSQRVDYNQIRFEDVLAGRSAQANRPIPFINSAVGIDSATVNNWFHSFNLKVERRFSRGLTFLANYTISKNVDSGNSGSSTYAGQVNTRAMDSYNLWRERGLAAIDIPQKLVLSSLYEFPLGPGKRFLNGRGPAGSLLGGWQVNGILMLTSGLPTDAPVAQRPPTFTLQNRPDVVLGQSKLVANPGFDQWFNPAAFSIPGTVPDVLGRQVRMYGNAGRNTLRGPGRRNLDLSLFKSFKTSERTSLQFRAEAFNLSNTPAFMIPNARSAQLTVGNANFGKLTGSGSVGRQIQFGLKFLF
jgi:hypothetical protein